MSRGEEYEAKKKISILLSPSFPRLLENMHDRTEERVNKGTRGDREVPSH